MLDDDLSSQPSGLEVRLSGAALLHNVRAFAEQVGTDAVQRAIARLPPDRRAEYEALVPVAWIRASTADLVYASIADEAGVDLHEVYPQIVRVGMGYSLKKAWRWLLVMATDAALVRRAPQLYAKGHDGGTLAARLVAPRHAELELTGWPDASELRLVGIGAAVAAALEAAGRERVEVTRTRTTDGARFDVRWGG